MSAAPRKAAGQIAVRVSVLALLLLNPAVSGAQPAARPDGWVVIPVDEYRALRQKAYPPVSSALDAPVGAALTRIEYDLRTDGESAAGEARLTVDVLREGWVTVEIPSGLHVGAARLDGRNVPIVSTPSPRILLSKRGRAVVSLDVVLPLTVTAGTEELAVPTSRSAVSRVALVVPQPGIDLIVTGGVLAVQPLTPEAPWIAFGSAEQPLTMAWRRRTESRAALPLRWRGTVIEHVGLGEETNALAATVKVDVFQGAASAIEVAVPESATIDQVSGPLVAEWHLREGVLNVEFLQPVSGDTAFVIAGEARLPHDGTIDVPLVRLPSAEREGGGVGVEVLGAGEIGGRQPRGLDAADPSELGEPISGRQGPSMLAFTYRPQPGRVSRSLTVNVARYQPQAVLVANVDEARYEALMDEAGKTLVRARYAVRNNQRAFLAVRLPEGATLWSAAVASRPLQPGLAGDGSLLVPLEKGRAGEELPAFAVELSYLQRTAAWDERGHATLALPAVDLPVARTGIVLHHSPGYRITIEPGSFRCVAEDSPLSAALSEDSLPGRDALPAPPAAGADTDLITGYQRQFAGRTIAGPLPVRVPFPRFGPSVFLASELTAELHAPVVEVSYKRERRW